MADIPNAMELHSRKPARCIAEIPAKVLEHLSVGSIESKNLVEWLAVDRLTLLETMCQDFGLSFDAKSHKAIRTQMSDLSALKQSQGIARHLAEQIAVGDQNWKRMASHTSDVVREWAALIVGLSELSFAKKLAWIKPLADDDNAGLREVAWIALRSDLIASPKECIQSLVPWTGSRRERLRRYASEITRPCGVWAPHIPLLKDQPELGLVILQPLNQDPSKYVRDSVGNRLNDARKTRPEWVRDLVAEWCRHSDSKETESIVRRALRTIG
jgi:3-methyladenine DNA glycosylase AlkC